jgi:hypothetical protein
MKSSCCIGCCGCDPGNAWKSERKKRILGHGGPGLRDRMHRRL